MMESLIISPSSCPVENAIIWPCQTKCLRYVRSALLRSIHNKGANTHYARFCNSMGRLQKIPLVAFSSPVGLEEELLSDDPEQCPETGEYSSLGLPGEVDTQAHNTDELKTLLADSQRADLLRKLSEANQQNRILKRHLQVKEDALLKFKGSIANIGRELQSLLELADEIRQSAPQESSGNISGQLVQPGLVSRLAAIYGKLNLQIGHVDLARSREVHVVWYGMAESAQVMGNFDGWSKGEHLSSEYDGSFTKFSTILLLLPGRYEIKFLVDGKWQVSPQFPTIGEGFMKNNLLIVE